MFESAIEINYYWLPLIGFLIGVLSTMIGGNGAFFFPPVLILFFQVSPRLAIATSLAAVLPIGLVGSLVHFRRGNINVPVGMLFGSAGLLGAFAGAWLSNRMDIATLINTFGIYLILLSLLVFYNPKGRLNKGMPLSGKWADVQLRQVWLMIVLGGVSGLVAGMFGTSGTAPVLAGLLLLQLPVQMVVGTSVLIVFINALAGFSGHFFLGEVDWQLILLLGSGAAAGAFVGPFMLSQVRPERNEGRIRFFFALLLLIFGIYIIVMGL
ncbi:MAG: sulfite exporter TauE/SafE family protein [Bacteroidales bacterium]|nr:sulfite exporter TauE/SafE family protein [Bacteroidales bacterium]